MPEPRLKHRLTHGVLALLCGGALWHTVTTGHAAEIVANPSDAAKPLEAMPAVSPPSSAPAATTPASATTPAPESVLAPPLSPIAPVALPTFLAAPTATPAPAPAAPMAPAVPVLAAPTESLRQTLQRLKLPLPLPDGRIVVTKSQRTLELCNGSTIVKTYHVALGANPVGHKQTQGDGRTPEGQFFICTRNASNSAFHIFLGLSYPALPDAARAVNSKQITWRDYLLIQQRLASRSAPLWSTRLGGWVGIHGGTDGAFAQRRAHERGSPDWTAGCIALTNVEIDEIYSATKLGTPVLVLP